MLINEIEYKISFEYWLNEDLRIFAVDNVITLEVEDDAIYLSSNNWFGETLLDEDIEYDDHLSYKIVYLIKFYLIKLFQKKIHGLRV